MWFHYTLTGICCLRTPPPGVAAGRCSGRGAGRPPATCQHRGK